MCVTKQVVAGGLNSFDGILHQNGNIRCIASQLPKASSHRQLITFVIFTTHNLNWLPQKNQTRASFAMKHCQQKRCDGEAARD